MDYDLKRMARKFGGDGIVHTTTTGTGFDDKRGKHKRRYKRWLGWDSIHDFIKVIKGEAPRDYALAEYFRDGRKRPSDWLIDEIQKPLENPFYQEVAWDSVVDEHLEFGKLESVEVP